MLISFHEMPERTIPGMNGGAGEMTAKMYMDENYKIISCAIHKGGSIGLHTHNTSDDINYVVSGMGKASCDGETEELAAGVCHVCRKGSDHSIINIGDDDLVLITVVAER